MRSKKILIVAESIDVEDSSGSKANVALIQNLNKAGFELRVYRYTRKNIKLHNIPCFAIRENRRSFLFFLSRLERQLRYKLDVSLNEFVESAFGFSFTHLNDKKSIAAALKEIKSFKPDLVLTLSKGSSYRPHHALLEIEHWHGRWMAYIHDPYPMHSYPRPYDYVEPGHQKKRRFFLNVSEKARYAAYPSKLLAEWMESYFHSLKGKSVIIPHQIFAYKEREVKLPNFFTKSSFTMVHAGALMSARSPVGLVNSYQKFLEEFPEAKTDSQLIFLGDNTAYSSFLSKKRDKIPQLYFSSESLGFKEVQNVQNQASVNVILEAAGPVSPFLPGKFPHCIAANNAILLLGPKLSESHRLLGEEYAYWSEINDVDRINKLITKLYFQWKKSPESLRLNRPDLEEYLSERYLQKILIHISDS